VLKEENNSRPTRPRATHEKKLTPLRENCETCKEPLQVGYNGHRMVTQLEGTFRLTIVVRRCVKPECPQYHVAYRPEEEGRWALPHGEFGLEILALIGRWRYREHRSVPQMHQGLLERGVSITERSVTNLMHRYEELVALRMQDRERLRGQLQKQGRVLLAIDGLQPDEGHEVLWVVRDCLSGDILLARPLLSSTHKDLVTLLSEVKEGLEQIKVPVQGVISDGQGTIGSAVAEVFPQVPHQLCQFHYLRDALEPLTKADQQARKQLKKHIRGVRPLERALEARNDEEAEAMRGYCLAVRAAITADGRAPLQPSGLTLYDRLKHISDSLARLEQKKAFLRSSSNYKSCSPRG
jgi:hypothetical protein